MNKYNSWKDVFSEISKKDYFKSLMVFLESEYRNQIIYPPKEEIFNAFKLTPYNNVKVVIIGQDPYFNKNQANGLAFSVNQGIKIPPSLKNIYREIDLEYNHISLFNDGDLTYLANQGVLLLNSILTVREKEPLSHNIEEYKLLFEDIMNSLDSLNKPIVFILFGNSAKKYEKYIKNQNHLVIKTSHPSPLSANQGGFFYSNCFKRANEFLLSQGEDEIKRIKC